VNTRKYLFVFTSCLWLGLTSISQAAPVNPKVIHLLNRLSLGIRPGEIDRVQKLGIDKYIQQQLNPDTIAESPILADTSGAISAIQSQSPSRQPKSTCRKSQNSATTSETSYQSSDRSEIMAIDL
jgi:uncharacterized protein (DUF1800 family)